MTREVPVRGRTLGASGLIALSACGFGAIPVLTLLAIRAGALLQGVLVARYAIATIALIAIVRPRALRLPRNHVLALAGVGGFGQVLLTFSALSALKYLPAATVSFLFYTYPTWVTLLQAARGAERLTPVRVAALVLAIAGLAVMIGSPFSGELSWFGVSLSLFAAIVYAIYIPLIGRLQAGIAPAVASTWVSIGALVLYLLLALSTRALVLPAGITGWSAIATLALISTVAAFILFLRGLAVLGPVRTSIISTVEPFFTALLAAFVLGQTFFFRQFVGGTLIAGAVILINLSIPERTQ